MKTRIRALLQAGCERVGALCLRIGHRQAERNNFGLAHEWHKAAQRVIALGYRLNPPKVFSFEEVTKADHIMPDGEA